MPESFNTGKSFRLHAEPTLLDTVKAPYRLGWAFLLAWVFCVFYLQLFGTSSGDALIASGATPMALVLIFNALPVFVSVATLATVIAAERHVGPPSTHPRLEFAMTVAAAAGTPLLLVSTGSIALTIVVFVAACLLTGIGSGVMWVSWGEHYARIPQEEVELFGPISAVLGALITLGVSAMNGWVAVAVVTSFPLISGCCLLVARNENEEREAQKPAHSQMPPSASSNDEAQPAGARTAFTFGIPASMGRTIIGIMVACLFVCIAGSLVEDQIPYSNLGVQVALFAATLFTLAIAVISVVGPRRISVAFFYRWMCPVLVLGFAAVILFGGAMGSYLAFTMSVAARFAFCLITQMYFARMAVDGNITAVQAYGWGWISVHLGDFLGVLVSAAFSKAILDGIFTLEQIAAASMVALVIATMFVIDDKRSFAAPGNALVNENAAESDGTADASDDSETLSHAFDAPSQIAGSETAADAMRPSQSTEERVAAIARKYRLTRREAEVFALLARGRSIPYVRDALVISRETAATHAKHIYAKLGVHSRQELIDLVADYQAESPETA